VLFRRWATERLKEYIIKGFVMEAGRFLQFYQRAILEHIGRIFIEDAKCLTLEQYHKAGDQSVPGKGHRGEEPACIIGSEEHPQPG
jgi:hypothetical protein